MHHRSWPILILLPHYHPHHLPILLWIALKVSLRQKTSDFRLERKRLFFVFGDLVQRLYFENYRPVSLLVFLQCPTGWDFIFFLIFFSTNWTFLHFKMFSSWTLPNLYFSLFSLQSIILNILNTSQLFFLSRSPFLNPQFGS